MDKEKLVARLELLQRERDQLISNLQAYEGAIQEVRYWIGQVEAENPEEPPSE